MPRKRKSIVLQRAVHLITSDDEFSRNGTYPPQTRHLVWLNAVLTFAKRYYTTSPSFQSSQE